MTSLTSRMACMIAWSWVRSATSTTKWLIPFRSSVTVTSALVMFPCREEMAELVRDVVIHEIGHYFGLDDARMEELEEPDSD